MFYSTTTQARIVMSQNYSAGPRVIRRSLNQHVKHVDSQAIEEEAFKDVQGTMSVNGFLSLSILISLFH